MPRLRVAGDGERAPIEDPKSLVEAAGMSQRALLVALRKRVALELDKGSVPPHAMAPLARQLRDIDHEIRLLDAAGVTGADDRQDLLVNLPEDAPFDESMI